MYRKKIGMLFAEALGTAVLTMVALNVSKSLGVPYFTASAVALTLGLMVLVIGNASGAHINPAVTVGLWSIRKIPTLQAVGYIAVQFLGALSAWRLFEYFSPASLPLPTEVPFDWRVLIAEAIGTMIFTFGIAATIYQRYEGLRAAVTVGTSLFIGVIIATAGSDAILNPAVAVGVRSLSRAYMLGPLAGAVVGTNLYSLLFASEAVSFPGVKRNPGKPAKTPVAPSSTGSKKKK
jgi:glycerol uptake facilitator protein